MLKKSRKKTGIAKVEVMKTLVIIDLGVIARIEYIDLRHQMFSN